MKALIAMSGGVDSSAAALLIKEQGFEGIGCTLKLCPALAKSEAADAEKVANTLGMPFYLFDQSEEFSKHVIENFVSEYLSGRTPNPCIECNRHLKFGALLDRADELGCDILVTGHYARITKDEQGYHLRKGLDPAKDQSYVLWTLTQKQLSRVRFPLGEYSKPDVRKIAEAHGFVNANKPDSQDICFVPDGDYASVIEKLQDSGALPKELMSKKGMQQGSFVDKDGKVLGKHKGIIHYTIGQRKGLGIALGEPAFVISTDPDKNIVVLGKNEDLMTKDVRVKGVNWTLGKPPCEPVKCAAKIRYRHDAQPAVIEPLEDGTAVIHFDEPQRAATPGQSAVFYAGDEVIGGGIITKQP